MTPAISAPKVQARSGGKPFPIDSRYVAPLLISVILITGHLAYGILADWTKTAVCVATSILVEIALGFLVMRKMPHLASAYVSGISCGILVRSTEWWPYLLAPAISVASKYVIRVDGRHLWNPSNFAIAVLLLLRPDTIYTLSFQWGNSIWAMLVIWTLGSVIIYRLKRFHICATYVGCFIAFAALRALVGRQEMGFVPGFQAELAPITGPMYQLFIFFMITDPRTTVNSKWGQMLVAFLVALMESLIRFYGPHWTFLGDYATHIASHAPYYALTLMGPTANIIEIVQKRKAKRLAAAA